MLTISTKPSTQRRRSSDGAARRSREGNGGGEVWLFITSLTSFNPLSMSTSQNRRSYSNATGRMAEDDLYAPQDKGLLVTKSSHTEDIHDHIDYWLAMSGQGKKWGVDEGTTFQMRSGWSSRTLGKTQAGCTEAPVSSLSTCQRKGLPL